MPNESDKSKEPVARPPRTTFRSPAFVQIYANTSQGAFTPWDISVIFGRLAFLDGEPASEELASITLSPHHAKAVAAVLAHAVASWEKQFGEIALGSGQMPSINEEPTPLIAPRNVGADKK